MLTNNPYLKTRRSFRSFLQKEIPDEVLINIFDLCRYSPTSMNSQSYYYIVIRDESKKKKLAKLRGSSSSPIAKAPVAIAIISDTNKTMRPKQDGTIAAYHFMLSSWLNGLGTCWIAAMDRDDAKEILELSKDQYIATVTPLGYPKEEKGIPIRRNIDEFVFYQ